MANRYVPGAPHPFFPKHKYFGVKLGGNMYPLSQAKVAYHVDSAARAKKAIETEMLTAEHLWATFQKEAEDVIRVNGSLDGHEQERNKRINAAYAKLWLADNRFQWAGLSSRLFFAVKVRLAMQQGLSDETPGVERGRAAHAA